MELLVNQDLDIDQEPLVITCNTSEGLLNSNYKTVVNSNFKNSTVEESLFGRRQGLKSTQFNAVNHTAVILKLIVFGIALLAIF